jgi:Sec-independent protein secretion pathway component TatC
MLAVPLCLLYEVSIWVTRVATRSADGKKKA